MSKLWLVICSKFITEQTTDMIDFHRIKDKDVLSVTPDGQGSPGETDPVQTGLQSRKRVSVDKLHPEQRSRSLRTSEIFIRAVAECEACNPSPSLTNVSRHTPSDPLLGVFAAC